MIRISLLLLVLLSACAPSEEYLQTVEASCNAQEKTHLGKVTCKCKNILAGYDKGDFTGHENYYIMSCAKEKLLAEKIDKKELTQSEADLLYLEWQQQQAALEAQQAAEEEAQRREQQLNQAIIKSLNRPQAIQDNSMNCTSRVGYGGTINTHCY